MTAEKPDGIAALEALAALPGSAELGDAYERLIEASREFLDALAGARIDVDQAEELAGLLDRSGRARPGPDPAVREFAQVMGLRVVA